MSDLDKEKTAELINKISAVMDGSSPAEAISALCAMICAIHVASGVGSNDYFVELVTRTLRAMLGKAERRMMQ